MEPTYAFAKTYTYRSPPENADSFNRLTEEYDKLWDKILATKYPDLSVFVDQVQEIGTDNWLTVYWGKNRDEVERADKIGESDPKLRDIGDEAFKFLEYDGKTWERSWEVKRKYTTGPRDRKPMYSLMLEFLMTILLSIFIRFEIFYFFLPQKKNLWFDKLTSLNEVEEKMSSARRTRACRRGFLVAAGGEIRSN